MACMYGRCRRVVGVGVWCAMALAYGAMVYAWRVCGYGVRCYGVGCTYGVRCVYVSCGVRCVYVVCIVL